MCARSSLLAAIFLLGVRVVDYRRRNKHFWLWRVVRSHERRSVAGGGGLGWAAARSLETGAEPHWNVIRFIVGNQHLLAPNLSIITSAIFIANLVSNSPTARSSQKLRSANQCHSAALAPSLGLDSTTLGSGYTSTAHSPTTEHSSSRPGAPSSWSSGSSRGRPCKPSSSYRPTRSRPRPSSRPTCPLSGSGSSVWPRTSPSSSWRPKTAGICGSESLSDGGVKEPR